MQHTVMCEEIILAPEGLDRLKLLNTIPAKTLLVTWGHGVREAFREPHPRPGAAEGLIGGTIGFALCCRHPCPAPSFPDFLVRDDA